MSKDLTVLGQELRTEFDDRRNILQKLKMDICQDIKDQYGNLHRQETADASGRCRSKLQLHTNVTTLLANFSQEETLLEQSLRENQVEQTRELTLWIKENRKHLNAWQKAVRYTHTGM